jgi:hypothetical protein
MCFTKNYIEKIKLCKFLLYKSLDISLHILSNLLEYGDLFNFFYYIQYL